MNIKAKCLNINQLPSGKALVQFAIPGKEENKPDGVINVQFQDGKKAKEFEHMKDYDISFKPIK